MVFAARADAADFGPGKECAMIPGTDRGGTVLDVVLTALSEEERSSEAFTAGQVERAIRCEVNPPPTREEVVEALGLLALPMAGWCRGCRCRSLPARCRRGRGRYSIALLGRRRHRERIGSRRTLLTHNTIEGFKRRNIDIRTLMVTAKRPTVSGLRSGAAVLAARRSDSYWLKPCCRRRRRSAIRPKSA